MKYYVISIEERMKFSTLQSCLDYIDRMKKIYDVPDSCFEVQEIVEPEKVKILSISEIRESLKKL